MGGLLETCWYYRLRQREVENVSEVTAKKLVSRLDLESTYLLGLSSRKAGSGVHILTGTI